jgi:acetyl esterase/lipase
VNATNSIAYVPIYPLTSENYSSQMDTNAFLLNLYKEVAHKHPNDEINIMGDSAGGNFALILAQEIKKHGLKKPKNVILLSPVLDFVINESAYKAFKKEEIFTKKFLLTCQSMQLCKNNPKNPLFSPIYGNCKDIGMIHLFVATNEVFYSSVIEFSKLLQKNKIRHTIEVRDNVFHDYPIFLFLKEAIETNKTICKIIKSKTK